MEYLPKLNELLEVLAYFGRRAAGHTTDLLLERLEQRGAQNISALAQELQPLSELTQRLDQALPIDEEQLQLLFGNLPGFPHNTIETFSRAFLLFYPIAIYYDGDPAKALSLLKGLSSERLNMQMAHCLDIADELETREEMSGGDLSARVLALSVPAESKVAILELSHDPSSVIALAGHWLTLAIGQLRKEQQLLEQLCAPFTAILRREGPLRYLTQTSSLSVQSGIHYELHPFVYGLDSNLCLTVPQGSSTAELYCGIHRLSLRRSLRTGTGTGEEVYNAIHLMGDRTRFDILCYLRDHTAYGQELSSQFNVSRNTIHHHMTKLLAARLITCTVDGNRVYYTLNHSAIANLLDQQRKLLLPEEPN